VDIRAERQPESKNFAFSFQALARILKGTAMLFVHMGEICPKMPVFPSLEGLLAAQITK
jgi:hypothetical protein